MPSIPATRAPIGVDAYADVETYYQDLAREVIARVEAAACERLLQCGSNRRRYNENTPLPSPTVHIDDGAIMALSRGETVHIDAAVVSVASLVEHASLSYDQWLRLADAARSLRRARTSLSADDHPAQALMAMEGTLGEPWSYAAAVVAATVHPVSCLVAHTFSRHRLNSPDDCEIGDLLRCLYGNPLIEMQVLGELGPEHPWFTHALLEWETHNPDEIHKRPLRPGVCFVGDAVGKGESVPTGKGVRVVRQDIALEEVVLSQEQYKIAAAVDLDMARRTGRAVGVLLSGPSGTGKTLLAHALAHSAKRSLVMIDPEQFRSGFSDIFGEDTGQVFTSILRRAAISDMPVFIDEADDLLGDGTAESQILLTALDRTPVTVILATNNPQRLDPALDRRMQVRIRFEIPSGELRQRILEREMTVQGWPYVHWPQADAIQQVARVWPLSGGYLANGVRGALSRARLSGRDPTINDLDQELAIIAKTQDGRTWPSGWRWELAEWQQDQALFTPQRLQHIAAVAQRVRQLSAAGQGVMIGVHGSDPFLFLAALRLFAMESASMALVYEVPLTTDSNIPKQHQPIIPEVPMSSQERMAIALPREVDSSLALICMRSWTLQGCILLRHLPDDGSSQEQALASIEVDWATLDHSQLQHLWDLWGGQGAPPQGAHGLSEVRAAIHRQQMRDLMHSPLPELP